MTHFDAAPCWAPIINASVYEGVEGCRDCFISPPNYPTDQRFFHGRDIKHEGRRHIRSTRHRQSKLIAVYYIDYAAKSGVLSTQNISRLFGSGDTTSISRLRFGKHNCSYSVDTQAKPSHDMIKTIFALLASSWKVLSRNQCSCAATFGGAA